MGMITRVRHATNATSDLSMFDMLTLLKNQEINHFGAPPMRLYSLSLDGQWKLYATVP